MLLYHSYNLINILQIFLRIISVSIVTVGAHITTIKQVRTILVKFSDSQKNRDEVIEFGDTSLSRASRLRDRAVSLPRKQSGSLWVERRLKSYKIFFLS